MARLERILRFIAGGLRHARVLLLASHSPHERQRVLAFRRLLRAAPAAMQAGGLPALMAHLEPAAVVVMDEASLDQAIRQADAVAAFARFMRFKDCMRRASLRYHVMRAAGQPAVMVIGVRRTEAESGIIGHAWIERDGQVFRESGHLHQEMAVMFRHPEHESAPCPVT